MGKYTLTVFVNAGDEEGGIEMTTSMVLIREFCKIFGDQAPSIRIVRLPELSTWDYRPHKPMLLVCKFFCVILYGLVKPTGETHRLESGNEFLAVLSRCA
jgi:hypothetical protein